MTTSTSRPATPERQPSPARRAVRWLLAAGVAALACAALLPDLVGLAGRGTTIQLVSFRPQLLAAGTAVLLVSLAVPWFRRAGWPLVAALAAVLLVAAAIVLPRAIPGPVPTTGRPLTVLSINVFEGDADAGALAELIRAERPDLVSVPEGGSRFAARLAPLVEPLGYRLHWTEAARSADVANVVAAVSDRLGPVQVKVTDAAAAFPYIEVTGGTLGELRLAAVHTQAPVRWEFATWKDDLAALRQWCAGPTPAVVAGDLNATLDHAELRAGMAGCTDAAAQRGAGLISTWGPGARSRMIGPQIDHVLVTSGITAQTFSVHDIPGSDHRAILTRLLLP